MPALPAGRWTAAGLLLVVVVLVFVLRARRGTSHLAGSQQKGPTTLTVHPASPLRPLPLGGGALATGHESQYEQLAVQQQDAGALNHTAHDIFQLAFFINAEGSLRRRHFMEDQLRSSGVAFERWPALHGSPLLLESHARYFERGVHAHLYLNHTKDGILSGWGTLGTYLSHHLLFEHIVARWRHDDTAAFLILQDDTLLKPDWLARLRAAVNHTGPGWERFLLVWWGLARDADCDGKVCVVKPPAGPTEVGPDCCGKRYYHGLQAWLVRVRSLRCLLRRLKRRPMKNIDALMVNCDCPRTYALAPSLKLGEHLDRELGSERAAVNDVWKSNLTQKPLSKSALRNMHKSWQFAEDRSIRPVRFKGRPNSKHARKGRSLRSA